MPRSPSPRTAASLRAPTIQARRSPVVLLQALGTAEERIVETTWAVRLDSSFSDERKTYVIELAGP